MKNYIRLLILMVILVIGPASWTSGDNTVYAEGADGTAFYTTTVECNGVTAVTAESLAAGPAEVASGSSLIFEATPMTIKYNGKKLDTDKTPVIIYQGTYMVPLEPVLCKQGPKLELEYGDNEHIKLIYENSVVTFFMGDDYYYSRGKKYHFTCKPFVSASGDYCFVPLKEICKALNLKCVIGKDGTSCKISGKKVKFAGKKIYTSYAYSLKAFARKEYNSVKRVSLKQYIRYVTTKCDTTHNFKYLRVDRYRPVKKEAFKRYYQYLIEDYCRQVGIKPTKSVLYGKAEVLLKAAKEYGLDPVYLANQTFLESAYGTSWLASGNSIKKIALPGFKQNSKGKFITRKIKKTVKVYNLYGIKAYDSDPYVGATSYAYYHGWTSVNKAIRGAAHYLKSNYVGGPNYQNTIFKMRYTFRASIWHQYATGPDYAESIGKRMYLMSSVYSDKATFLYDLPKYK